MRERAPAITFESPGERMAATRLNLNEFGTYLAKDDGQDVSFYQNVPIWHFGLSTDPLFTGHCKGVYSACYIAGYAMESRCHTGHVCLLDALQEPIDEGHDDGKDRPHDIRTHRLDHVVNLLQEQLLNKAYRPQCHFEHPSLCDDCVGWTYTDVDSKM
jgi:lipase ATG15